MRNSRQRMAAASAALITALYLTGCTHAAGSEPRAAADPPSGASAGSGTPGNVTLTTAQRQSIHLYTVGPSTFHKSIETSGTVDFDNDQATTVLAPFSGPVSRLLVSLGAQVRQGDALAMVQSPDFASAIDAYRKALATARTDRRLAALEKDLSEHNGVAQREAEQAETDAVNAEADRDAALQALIALNVPAATIRQIEAGQTVTSPAGTIRSPIAGTVVEKLITPGELLQAGTTACFTVADLSRVWVMAQLFGSDLAAVSIGDSADILTDTGAAHLSGTVDNVAALVDPDTRAVAVRVVANNPGGMLRKQMYVRVLIQARQQSTGLLVPVAAILRDDENLPFVYVASADGSFERRHVTLGYRTGDQYDIDAGLQTGDRIVVEGGIFVQFMQNQ